VHLLLHRLAFDAFDPRTHPYDEAIAREAVTRVVRIAVGGDLGCVRLATGWDRDKLEAAITQSLVDSVGIWAGGFSWAATEPGGGGPVHGYCCAKHSLLAGADPDARASIERVLMSVAEFRAFLVELVYTFESIATATSGLTLDESVERAAARLLPDVLARTGAEDAWYSTFASVLGFYLDFAGFDRARVVDVVENTISGRFSSWITPSADLAATTAAELGVEVAIAQERPSTAESVDAIAEWKAVRASAFANVAYPWSIPIGWDGHRRYIERVESSRDPVRATRMGIALDACRAAALRDAPLDFELLSRWQSIVLGHEATFRTTDAFAKRGRERSPIDAGTRRRFDDWLAQADDRSTPVHVRAARVFLDVCFVHPFEDGNARAARLGLDYVLAREGLYVRAIEPLIALSRAAGDRDGAYRLAWIVGFLAGPKG